MPPGVGTVDGVFGGFEFTLLTEFASASVIAALRTSKLPAKPLAANSMILPSLSKMVEAVGLAHDPSRSG